MIFHVPNQLFKPQTFSISEFIVKQKYFFCSSRYSRLKKETFTLYPTHSEYTERPDGQRKLSGKLANFIFWLIPTIEPFHSETAELHGFWLFAIINNWFIPGTVCKMFVKYRTNRDVRRNQFSALLGGHRAINSFIDNCSF